MIGSRRDRRLPGQAASEYFTFTSESSFGLIWDLLFSQTISPIVILYFHPLFLLFFMPFTSLFAYFPSSSNLNSIQTRRDSRPLHGLTLGRFHTIHAVPFRARLSPRPLMPVPYPDVCSDLLNVAHFSVQRERSFLGMNVPRH